MTRYKSNLEKTFNLRFNLPYEQSRLPYQVTHQYTPDFNLSPNLYVETKGLFTGADRSKHLHIQKQHPEVTVLFVFQDPNRHLSKQSRTTYAAWCHLHNFKYLSLAQAQQHSRQSLITYMESK